MRQNKELGLIENSLKKAHKAGRFLFVVFSLATVLFAVLLCLNVVILLLGFSQFPDKMALMIGSTDALVQNCAMICSFSMCALVARDVSGGKTPFSDKQIGRIRIAAWSMLVYTIFCLLWSPLAITLQFSFGSVAYDVVAGQQPGDINLNFETLIAAGAFFLFAYILSYGKTLQELADEAL